MLVLVLTKQLILKYFYFPHFDRRTLHQGHHLMITADIPITMTSTADPSLSLDDFIEYSIKNDLNIVKKK